jgi:predicted ABC-type ATPase
MPMSSELGPPKVVIIAGPNGAGKTTITPRVLRKFQSGMEWVNADVIARGLSGLQPESAAWEASRVMLERLRRLAGERKDFAFETTLAARTHAAFIRELLTHGYEFYLFFVIVPSPDVSVARVKQRVMTGGHNVPEEAIRRRYGAAVNNFFHLYRPLAFRWTVYDNSYISGPRLVATGAGGDTLVVADSSMWNRILEQVK